MDPKVLFGLTVIPAGFLCGIIAACISKRIRDLFFVLLVTLSPLIERLDLNYVSREWYRGTSRGFEVAVLDVLSLSLLVSSVLVPRRSESRAYFQCLHFRPAALRAIRAGSHAARFYTRAGSGVLFAQ
jgi:hypothetical protein